VTLRRISITVRATLAALALGTILAAGCASDAPPKATTTTCFNYGVQALKHHITVTSIPAACAGLSRTDTNVAVGRAIRENTRGLHKVEARRVANRDSHYLAALVLPVAPARPASPGAPTGASQTLEPGRLAALAAWFVTAIAGAYLFAGLRTPGRRRMPAPIAVGHGGLAVAGLVIWIAYLLTGTAALSWVAVGLTFVIAGLGMATLLAGMPDTGDVPSPAPSPAALADQAAGPPSDQPAGAPAGAGVAAPPRRTQAPTTTSPVASAAASIKKTTRAPAFVIALHGALATATILLVLLAAVGAG
jgi:manganese efflux pump family protein